GSGLAAARPGVAGIGRLVGGNVGLHGTAWVLVRSIPGVLITRRFTVALPDVLLRTSLGTVLTLSGLKLVDVREANWVLGAGLVALAVALVSYGIRVWIASRPARQVETPDTFPA